MVGKFGKLATEERRRRAAAETTPRCLFSALLSELPVSHLARDPDYPRRPEIYVIADLRSLPTSHLPTLPPPRENRKSRNFLQRDDSALGHPPLPTPPPLRSVLTARIFIGRLSALRGGGFSEDRRVEGERATKR